MTFSTFCDIFSLGPFPKRNTLSCEWGKKDRKFLMKICFRLFFPLHLWLIISCVLTSEQTKLDLHSSQVFTAALKFPLQTEKQRSWLLQTEMNIIIRKTYHKVQRLWVHFTTWSVYWDVTFLRVFSLVLAYDEDKLFD